MPQEKTEIQNLDWMAYITVAWKRRWLIVIPTVILAVLAAVVSFLLPKVWQVDMIIIPSKFMTQTQTGEFKIVLVAEPKQIASQITEGSYDSLIAAEVNIPEREFPAIKAENLRDTNLVRASVREKDPQKGKRILDSLFNHLKSEFDIKIDIEISNLNNQIEMTKNKIREFELNIESRKIDKEKTRRDIESDKNKFTISENRIGSIQVEMKSVRTRIAELDVLQKKNMSEKKEGTETLALLLYSNEVQQNLRYFNTLDETLSAERVNIENLTYSIKSKEQQLLQIDNQISQIQNNISNANNDINLLADKKGRIDYTQLIKVPTVSFNPVSPHKKQNVLMAAFIGFCLSLGFVFLIDYLEKQKK